MPVVREQVETDTHTHTQTHRPSTVTLAAHARRGLTTSSMSVVISELKPGAFYLCMVGARSQAGLQHSVSTILMELPPDGNGVIASSADFHKLSHFYSSRWFSS